MEILRGMEVKITGVIHRLFFFLNKFFFFFFFFIFIFFFLGGGAYLCKLLGGGHGPPVPPIPTALLNISAATHNYFHLLFRLRERASWFPCKFCCVFFCYMNMASAYSEK